MIVLAGKQCTTTNKFFSQSDVPTHMFGTFHQVVFGRDAGGKMLPCFVVKGGDDPRPEESIRSEKLENSCRVDGP